MPVEPVRYFSTNTGIFGSPDLEERISGGDLPTVGLAQAIIQGQADDGGLLMPNRFPQIGPKNFGRMGEMSYSQIFSRIMNDFFQGILQETTLRRISNEAYTFQPYIEKISDTEFLARLDEGPTAAFKDYAAQVLFRIIESLMKEVPETEIEFRSRLKDIPLMSFIVTTSGDTGGAMGSACHGRDKMWMAILHSADIPGHVSELQAKQMEFNGNVYTIRVDTDFDGCASLASRLISDPELRHINPNSANSVNIGRLLPQTVYYFHALSRVLDQNEPVAVSVPSGNFGNAVAGLFAMRMGLPITKMIIGVNENDIFERFYRTGKYEPAESAHTSPSNSMNVNKPSNMRRLFQLYGGQLIDGKVEVMPDMQRLRDEISVYRISDEETDQIIRQFYDEFHTINLLHSTLEPHGAVAWGAARKFREETGYDGKIITLETAHPGKFPERIEKMGIKGVTLPECLAKLVDKPHGRHYRVKNDYSAVKELILELYAKELRRAA